MPNARTQKRVDNNLGIIRPVRTSSKSRNQRLEKIDKYLSNTQYDHLSDWTVAECSKDYIKIRQRKPCVIYPFAQVLSDRLSSKLLGANVFPSFKIEDDPGTEGLMKVINRTSYIKPRMLSACKKLVLHGSSFIRFKLIKGAIFLEHFNSKYCYPKFDEASELIEVRIQYVYEDPEDLDEKGQPIKKWYKMEIGQMSDVLYDNPKYESDVEPTFIVVKVNQHELGFVQGEWFQTVENRHSPDGFGIIDNLFGFIDSLNYNLSQSDRAVSYGLDPQLIISNMTEDEFDTLIKSSAKGWTLGLDGKADFLEVNGSGAKTAEEYRNEMIKNISDIARIVMLDPEKMVGHAQSAKAMEVLHGPLVELVNELRPQVEKGLISLEQKMIALMVIYNKRGAELSITMPPQYAPISLDIEAMWPPIFPKTVQDLTESVRWVSSATNANIISRETALRKIAKDFDVEDIEEEIQRVNTQQQFNTFGF